MKQGPVKSEVLTSPCFKQAVSYNPQQILAQIKGKKIQGLLLVPSTKRESQIKAIELVKAIKQSGLPLPIFGSDTIYSGDISKNEQLELSGWP